MFVMDMLMYVMQKVTHLHTGTIVNVSTTLVERLVIIAALDFIRNNGKLQQPAVQIHVNPATAMDMQTTAFMILRLSNVKRV